MSPAEQAKQFGAELAIVLGSGLGSFVDRMDIAFDVPYGGNSGLPVSSVPGHAGRLVFGTLGGVRIAAAQGRVHLYEGRSAAEVTTGVRWLAAAGVKRLILTNAAGSLNPHFPPGQWMMLSDHLNLTGTSPLLGGPNFIDMTRVYCPEWRSRFLDLAGQRGLPLHEGVYAGLLGPQYETPAEVRMIRSLGADAVGMSTVLEAIQARALGLQVAAFSCLTNWGAGLSPDLLSHTEVMETGHTAAAALAALLEDAITAS